MKRTTAEALLEYIQTHVGVYKSELSEHLGVSWGTISHHLHKLSRSGKIVIEQDGYRTWVYRPDSTDLERAIARIKKDPIQEGIFEASERDKMFTTKAAAADSQIPYYMAHRRLRAMHREGVLKRNVDRPMEYFRPEDSDIL